MLKPGVTLNDQDSSSILKNKNGKKIRVMLAVLCFLIIMAGVSLYSIYNLIENDNSKALFQDPNQLVIAPTADQTDTSATGDNQSTEPGNSAITPVPTTTNLETIQYNGKTYARNPNIVNLLFLGIDYTVDRSSLDLGTRSDMVLVCALDTVTKKVTLISIPRDTKTTIKELNKTGKITKTEQNKINTAYHFGNDYAAQNAMDCVQMFLQRQCKLKTKLSFNLNIPVYLYASIDIDGIAPVASAVGGIEVTLAYSIPGVGRNGQTVLLTGDKAANYIRDRHDDPDGDLGRASKEQYFMVKLAKKIKDNGIVNDILSLYSNLQKYVKTNLTTLQMVDFAKILSNVDIDSIQTYTIPGSPANDGTTYFYADEEQTLELLLSIYYNQV